MNDLERDCLFTIAALWNCSAVVLTAAALATVAASVKNRPRRIKRYAIHPINQKRQTLGHYNNVFMELKEDPEKFYRYTRMSLQQFNILLNLLEPEIKKCTKYRTPIPSEMRLVITLRYLATGESIFSMHLAYRLGESTIRKIIYDVCQAIWKVIQPLYLSPPTVEEYKLIAEDFYNIWNLPHCLGAVDGKHIRMKGPEHSNSLYYNYKGFFSVVLMAISDANYNFTLVEIGHVGSVCDSTIFRQCEFGQRIMNQTLEVPQDQPLPGQLSVLNYAKFPFFFIGDEAFPLKTNIMRPFPKGQLSKDQVNHVANRIFNYRLCRARRVVENAFGILVAKWRIFHTLIEVTPEHGVLLVQACVCLHNFIRKTDSESGQNIRQKITGDVYKMDVLTPGTWRQHVEGNQMKPIEFRSSRNYTYDAKTIRDNMAVYFCNEGSVSWQWRSSKKSYNK